MKSLALLLLWLPLSASALHQRMTVSFHYKGEPMKATFFTTVRDAAQNCEEAIERSRAALFLDKLRFEHYTERANLSNEEATDLRLNLFNWEKLSAHDEIMVLHRGNPRARLNATDPFPLGIGEEILGMIAVDRLGNTFLDCLPGYDSPTYEELLIEKRLAPLGIKIPRPLASPYISGFMPKGLFKHWEPLVAERYYQPQNLVWGDVIHANALFAQEGTWPLIHSLANGYGLFSTGRIIPRGKQITVGGFTYEGPRVFVPTLVVWEVFNKMDGFKVKKGSRTKYYEASGASPLMINGRNQWKDPRLGFGNLVQVMAKTGDEFRHGWTEQFAERDHFSFVRDVTIDKTEFETIDGTGLISRTVPTWAAEISHHPHQMNRCVNEMLEARHSPVAQLTIPLTITVSIGQPVLRVTNRPPDQ